MNDWLFAQETLAQCLADFLGDALAELGGEKWWEHHVVMQLSPMQQRAIANLAPGDVRGLDLQALLKVVRQNWSELAFRKNLSRNRKGLIAELEEARNRYAHAPASGVDLEDVARDVQTVCQFLKVLNAPAGAVADLNARHRRLQAAIVQEGIEPPDASTPDGTQGSSTAVDNTASAAPPHSVIVSDTAASREEEPPDSSPKTGGWLVEPRKFSGDIKRALGARTFVGIDFGTSTTVVSVVSTGSDDRMSPKTIVIDQPEEFGGTISHHLVNSVIAWHDGRLLFGHDAFRLRQSLFEGRNVFSSFKMRLGVSIGPTYPETELVQGRTPVTVETASDAAREFFKLLGDGIRGAISREGLPPSIEYAVSVPASFEANQRRDLLDCLQAAELAVAGDCLIDEPNAAFLSFLHGTAARGGSDELLDKLRSGPTNLLVYDFGAGTCDVSILEVSVSQGRLKSRNRAISRFTALGGDDFDRAIASNVLLPQLLQSAPGFEPELRDVEERLVPRLQPTAERLKIACVKWITDRGMTTTGELRKDGRSFSDNPTPAFTIRATRLSLAAPSLSLSQLADCLEPFLGRYDPDESTAHVFAPIADALDKSGLRPEQLDAVLFIGGSAANPLVRASVMRHLPPSVRAVVPADLRSHVSLGAALHSLGYHAFGFDLIKPITSEPIYVITRGGGLETVVPAGSEVPTQQPFHTTLTVERAGQQVVEMPICVSSENKLLGLLRLEAPTPAGFALGTNILLRASVNHEKLLKLDADAGGSRVAAMLLNPMTNSDMTPEESLMFEARQRFNEELLRSGGRPARNTVVEYARAAVKAKAFETAADMFVAAERINPDDNFASQICHAYSMAGRFSKASEWARRAYDRDANAMTAYNMSVFCAGAEKERFLRESVGYSNPPASAFLQLGRLLREKGVSQEGTALVERCVAALEKRLDSYSIDDAGCRTLAVAARELHKVSVAERAESRLAEFTGRDAAYDDENLAASASVTAYVTEV